MTSLQIISVNSQGLGQSEKRKDVFNYLKTKKYNIYCIQDTHFTKNLETFVQNQWGFQCLFSSFTNQARGVAILYNNNFGYKINKTVIDEEGNFIIIDIIIEETNITLANIYGPNSDTPSFYEKLFHKINEINNENTIICGDFNLALDQTLDTQNYLHVNNPKSKQTVIENIAKFDLIDVFREIYPTLKRYTWRKKNPVKQARLDYFLISQNLISKLEKITTEMSYRSDHSPVVLNLKLTSVEKGKALWKFNTSLLKDKRYINLVKETINNIKCQYAIPVYKINAIHNIDNKDIQFIINDEEFLDILLMEIRAKSMSYSIAKSKDQQKIEVNLIQAITTLEQKTNLIIEQTNSIETKQKQLSEIRNTKMRGNLIRSRAQWVEQGEKPSKYFCKLESRNYYGKLVTYLKDDDGNIINDQNSILKKNKKFYESLYAKEENKGYSEMEFFEKVKNFDFKKNFR
ncbi:hypothetical protein SNE40_006185 [Patella caerulea]|uniref:exodeoxyribonuclease III n=1 Tax=Patella caerulea TaxID=87958 RepID=A0AAN8PZK1_PATCE